MNDDSFLVEIVKNDISGIATTSSCGAIKPESEITTTSTSELAAKSSSDSGDYLFSFLKSFICNLYNLLNAFFGE